MADPASAPCLNDCTPPAGRTAGSGPARNLLPMSNIPQHNALMNIPLDSRFTRRFGLSAPDRPRAHGACLRRRAGGGVRPRRRAGTGRRRLWRARMDPARIRAGATARARRRMSAAASSCGSWTRTPRRSTGCWSASRAPSCCRSATRGRMPRASAAGAAAVPGAAAGTGAHGAGSRRTVIVGQGGEAGGHGMNALNAAPPSRWCPSWPTGWPRIRPTRCCSRRAASPTGARLAAARVLGADGALVGSRLWATAESLARPAPRQLAVGPMATHGAQQRVRHPAAQELAGARTTSAPSAMRCIASGKRLADCCARARSGAGRIRRRGEGRRLLPRPRDGGRGRRPDPRPAAGRRADRAHDGEASGDPGAAGC